MPQAVVVGASVSGLAGACALAESGWEVTLVERRPDLLEGGRAFLLQPNGLAALERLGALAAVRERALTIAKVAFHLDGDDPVAVYDYGELRHPQAYALEIRPRELRLALAARAEQLGVPPPRFGCEAIDVVRDEAGHTAGIRCRDANGETVEQLAELVVAADGPGSRMRDALGIRCRRFSHADRYVLGTVDVPRPTRDLHVYCGPGYANGVCPLPDGTYFWDCVTDANRAAVDARDLDGWRDAYSQRVASSHEFMDGVQSWDQLTTIDARTFWAKTSAVPGAVLVGDAAGAVHPHSAQGANLALEDAAALNDGLDRHAKRHRRRRRFVLWSLVAAGSLDAPNLAWRFVRRTGFMWNRVGPMRRQLLRRQAGLSG